MQMQLMLTVHQTLTQAPAWTSPVLHTGNVIAAVLDLWLSTGNRTFNNRSLALARGLSVIYLGWCVEAKQFNGSYPYDSL